MIHTNILSVYVPLVSDMRLIARVEVVTSGPGSGWNRGRLPATIGKLLESGAAVGYYLDVKRDRRPRCAVKIGSRWYTRLASANNRALRSR